jgi:O-methyltransferase
MPDSIAFAFLDGDFYDSILSSLRLVWPRMSKGGAVLVHDYKRETLPGVERAINDFFHGAVPRLHYEKHIAIFRDVLH